MGDRDEEGMDLAFVKVLTERKRLTAITFLHIYILKNSRISYCTYMRLLHDHAIKKRKLHQAWLIHSVASCDRGGKGRK
jgi:hypothetical protein